MANRSQPGPEGRALKKLLLTLGFVAVLVTGIGAMSAGAGPQGQAPSLPGPLKDKISSVTPGDRGEPEIAGVFGGVLPPDVLDASILPPDVLDSSVLPDTSPTLDPTVNPTTLTVNPTTLTTATINPDTSPTSVLPTTKATATLPTDTSVLPTTNPTTTTTAPVTALPSVTALPTTVPVPGSVLDKLRPRISRLGSSAVLGSNGIVSIPITPNENVTGEALISKSLNVSARRKFTFARKTFTAAGGKRTIVRLRFTRRARRLTRRLRTFFVTVTINFQDAAGNKSVSSRSVRLRKPRRRR